MFCVSPCACKLLFRRRYTGEHPEQEPWSVNLDQSEGREESLRKAVINPMVNKQKTHYPEESPVVQINKLLTLVFWKRAPSFWNNVFIICIQFHRIMECMKIN